MLSGELACSTGQPFKNIPSARVQQREKYDVPIVMNADVERWIDYFTNRDRERFALYLRRSGRYVPYMRDILAEEGLPQDLVYLAMIESGFSTSALSRASASGPWQFMRPTGRAFGLESNWWRDERRDPSKATRAAAQYLKRLHDEFGDWYLAMAAYNAGEGKVRRAIRSAHSKDFWKLADSRRSHLHSETRNYVPKYIAATIIAKNPRRYGFNHVIYEEPYSYDQVDVEGPLDLEVAAELIGASPNDLKDLNPELRNWMIPALRYTLKVPGGRGSSFLVAYQALPPEQKVRTLVHKIQNGETILKIAKRYGVSKNAIVTANSLSKQRANILQAGQTLIIPKGNFAAALAGEEGETISIRVKPGDSLGKIARRYRVSVAKIKRENGLSKDFIRSGQRLKITTGIAAPEQSRAVVAMAPTKAKKEKLDGVEFLIRKDNSSDNQEVAAGEENSEDVTQEEEIIVSSKETSSDNSVHVIQRGDTLWHIAQKYGVRINDLKEWNGVNNVRRLMPGKPLVVSK
ncbi:MAG: LysM peptidoglycan-binding domain-containing protein [Deltaproteobacteria bacterium]|nr:LysM peptidoglycan-binding domain-containing protein [Deltaproteobacteria bacterium]